MLNDQEIERLRLFIIQELKENADLFDFNAEMDKTLEYWEAKNNLAEKIELFKEKNPLESIKKKHLRPMEEQAKERNPEVAVSKWLRESVNKSKIYGVIAKRGGGKSCFAFAFLEWHKLLSSRKCYVYRFPKPQLLPSWITPTIDMQNVEKGSVVLIDESGIEFNQFSFNKEKSIEIANILKTARHKDLSVIFIAQNGANMTRDIRRMIDCYILREPSFTQLYDEISVIKRMYQNCFMLFKTEDMAKRGFFITEIGEMGTFDKPEWFSEEISKSYDGENTGFNVSDYIKTIEKEKV